MAHQIENNQFAYVGEAAWHGLGVQLAEGATGQEMLQAAGLAWRVQRRGLAMASNKVGGAPMTEPMTGYRAITRSDNNHVFQVASDRYQPVQNTEIVDFFREFCEAGHASMETVGALRDGAVIWALAKLATTTPASLGQDKLTGHMMLATSHDGSLRTIGKPCQTRVVCGNTLQIALGEQTAQYSLKHSSKFTDRQKDEAKRVMGMARESVQAINDLAGELAKATVDHDGWMEFMGKLLGEDGVIDTKTADLTRVAAEIQSATMTSPGSGFNSARGTMWGLVNGVTYYVDHAARARSESNRLFSAWFGDGERMKNTAVRIAADMAGVAI
jgi:phage/plasmid-like protein (TIGR03299 family)